jgi:hypothetical protein
MKTNRGMMNLAGHVQIDHKPIKNAFRVSIPRHALKTTGIKKATRILKYT